MVLMELVDGFWRLKRPQSSLREKLSPPLRPRAELRPEKMISQSEKSDGMQRRTTMSANLSGRGTECFQRATSEYRSPCDLAEAPSATSSR